MQEMTKQAPRWISGIEPPEELLKASGTQILEIECREQPACLRELIKTYSSDSAIRAELKKFRDLAMKNGPLLFIGMGASFCSAISGKITPSGAILSADASTGSIPLPKKDLLSRESTKILKNS